MTSDNKAINELAKHGLETAKKIDQLIEELWRELQKVSPDLAEWLEQQLGSGEFATFLMMDRIHNRPSFLETLADHGADTLKALLRLELDSNFSKEVKKNTGDETETAGLSTQAERARKNYESDLIDIFKKLKEHDLEVASETLDLWDDPANAAEFIAKPARAFLGKSPLQMLENGERQEVLDLISKLKYGVFS